MKLKLVAFGIAKDILGEKILQFEMEEGENTIADLKRQLQAQYPELSRLRSLQLAVNTDYQKDDFQLNDQDEIVIIPPVSGG